MKTKLKSLKLSNFRSFANAQISFPTKGLVLLRGPSGAGKSSIGLAIAYAFGYCPFPGTALQAWGAEEPLEVELLFESNGEPAKLVRGKKLGLCLGDERTTFRGGAAKIEEKIQELTGLTPETLEALTYRGQRTPGLFLSKPDSEKKEFLCKILGLDTIEEAIEKSQKTIKDIEAGMSVDSNSEKWLRENLNATQMSRPELLPVPEASPELAQKINDLENSVSLCAERIKEARADVAKKVAEFSAPVEKQILGIKEQISAIQKQSYQPPEAPELIRLTDLLKQTSTRLEKLASEDDVRRSLLLKEASRLTAELTARKARIGTLEALQRDKAKFQKDLAVLAENVCPTCDQFWLQATDHAQKLQKKIAEIEQTIAEIESLKATLPPLEAEIEKVGQFDPNPLIAQYLLAKGNLETQIKEENSRLGTVQVAWTEQKLASISVLQSTQDALRQSIKDFSDPLSVELARTIEQMEKEVQKHRIEIAQARKMQEEVANRIRDIERQNDAAKAKYDAYVTNKNKLEEQLQILQETMAPKVAQLKVENDFVKLLGREGFLGTIFDEILYEIAAETNIILAAIPNVSHVTIRFSSENVTQKGTVKKTIVPIVSVNGNDAPLGAGLSGGMLSSVELAVDLAVGKVLARRSNCSPGWLILDEAFDGLATADKSACMEMLRQAADDRLILIVDHDSVFQECFAQIIDIETVNGKSQIKE